MPVTYSIDVSERLIRTRCAGNVTVSEVLEHFQTLVADSLLTDHLDVLLDVRETTSLPDRNQLAAVTYALGQVGEKVKFKLCAIVAASDAMYGMQRMFEVMAQPHFQQICVFREIAEAETWLLAQRHLDG